ncbi:MAG: peptide-methionine (S)-S-oxide reductase MsrA [Candidatus Andersenbacteria bacterium]|nr:peptide-methionine (S)-S-oxide reductase MsrA [Candidatus Andersenbacteria bacterium]
MELATFGGGCFWCTEAIFQRLKGVESVVPGYAGGITENPTYEEVCAGTTGHAEVIQVEFDPTVLSYKQLLEVFFKLHDPTTVNRQGPDTGTQYRSVIFAHSEQQKKTAEDLITELDASGEYKKKIVTEVASFEKFYKAENYHENYYNSNRGSGYCLAVIDPKIEKLYKQFGDLTKPEHS